MSRDNEGRPFLQEMFLLRALWELGPASALVSLPRLRAALLGCRAAKETGEKEVRCWGWKLVV